MKIGLLILIIILMPCITAYSTEETILRTFSSALICYDWLQTKEFRRKGMPETNPILGKYPSQYEVDLMIGSGLLINIFLPYLIPKKYRIYFYVSVIRSELKTTNYNYSVGLRGF